MRRLFVALVAVAFAAQGCLYVGAAGLAALLTAQEEVSDNLPPAAYSNAALSLSANGDVAANYTLSDPESDRASVEFEYSIDGGSAFSACTERPGAPSEGVTALAAWESGAGHVYVWDAAADLSGYNVDVVLRVTPIDGRDSERGCAHVFPQFRWNPNLGPSVSVLAPAQAFDAFAVQYTVADPESDPADLVVEYSVDSGASWNPATGASGLWSPSLLNVPASSAGSTREFVWNSAADTGPQDRQAMLRFRATDRNSSVAGAAAQAVVSLLNSRPATVAGAGLDAFGAVSAVVADSSGVVYFSEHFGHRVWAVNCGSAAVTVLGQVLHQGQMKPVAGSGVQGFDGDHKAALLAALDSPSGLAVELGASPALFIADAGNNRIRMVDNSTGFITTIAGSGSAGSVDNVPAGSCTLNGPSGVACDWQGNVYVADTLNHAVRMYNRGASAAVVGGITVAPGFIRCIAGIVGLAGYSGDGGQAHLALLDSPLGVSLDTAQNVFIADTGNHAVRMVNPADPSAGVNLAYFGAVVAGAGEIATVAGSGLQGFAGDGGYAAAPLNPGVRLDSPSAAAVRLGVLYVADTGNHAVRAVNGSPTLTAVVGARAILPGRIDTIAGQGGFFGFSGDSGDAAAALLDGPSSLSFLSGALLVADSANRRVRFVNTAAAGGAQVSLLSAVAQPGQIQTLAHGTSAPLRSPAFPVARADTVFVSDPAGHRVWALETSARSCSVVAGAGTSGWSGDGGPAESARLNSPLGLAIDPVSNRLLLVADSGNNCIRAVCLDQGIGGAVTAFGETVAAGQVRTLGLTLGAIIAPAGMGTDASGDLYVCGSGDHRIWKVDRATGAVSAAAGDGVQSHLDGASASARFDSPFGICAVQGALFVADRGNHAIRVVNTGISAVAYGAAPFELSIPAGNVGTLAGIPGSAGFCGDGKLGWVSMLSNPGGLHADQFGTVTFCDSGNGRIRRIQGGSGILTTVAGAGGSGFNGDGLDPLQTLFGQPSALCAGASGALYVADSQNGRIRRFGP